MRSHSARSAQEAPACPVAIQAAFTVSFLPGYCPAAANALHLGVRIKCLFRCLHSLFLWHCRACASLRRSGAGSALCRLRLTQRGNPGTDFHFALQPAANIILFASAAFTGDFRICYLAAAQDTAVTLSGTAMRLPGLPGLEFGQDEENHLSELGPGGQVNQHQ